MLTRGNDITWSSRRYARCAPLWLWQCGARAWESSFGRFG